MKKQCNILTLRLIFVSEYFQNSLNKITIQSLNYKFYVLHLKKKKNVIYFHSYSWKQSSAQEIRKISHVSPKNYLYSIFRSAVVRRIVYETFEALQEAHIYKH